MGFHRILCQHSLLHNIHDTRGLQVKLCDLECSRHVGDPFPNNGQSLRYTELYASPEVLRGKAGELKASLQMDLLSLGLVLWQLANKQSELPVSLQNSSERDELYAAKQDKLDAALRPVSREGCAYCLLGTAFELCRLALAERPSFVTLAGKLPCTNRLSWVTDWTILDSR